MLTLSTIPSETRKLANRTFEASERRRSIFGFGIQILTEDVAFIFSSDSCLVFAGTSAFSSHHGRRVAREACRALLIGSLTFWAFLAWSPKIFAHKTWLADAGAARRIRDGIGWTVEA